MKTDLLDHNAARVLWKNSGSQVLGKNLGNKFQVASLQSTLLGFPMMNRVKFSFLFAGPLGPLRFTGNNPLLGMGWDRAIGISVFFARLLRIIPKSRPGDDGLVEISTGS